MGGVQGVGTQSCAQPRSKFLQAGVREGNVRPGPARAQFPPEIFAPVPIRIRCEAFVEAFLHIPGFIGAFAVAPGIDVRDLPVEVRHGVQGSLALKQQVPVQTQPPGIR